MAPFWKTWDSSQTTQYSLRVGNRWRTYFITCKSQENFYISFQIGLYHKCLLSLTAQEFQQDKCCEGTEHKATAVSCDKSGSFVGHGYVMTLMVRMEEVNTSKVLGFPHKEYWQKILDKMFPVYSIILQKIPAQQFFQKIVKSQDFSPRFGPQGFGKHFLSLFSSISLNILDLPGCMGTVVPKFNLTANEHNSCFFFLLPAPRIHCREAGLAWSFYLKTS